MKRHEKSSTQPSIYAAIGAALLVAALAGCSTVPSSDFDSIATSSMSGEYPRVGEG
ncbi:MAG: hypothetical protein H6R02_2665 [Burkholderiaceae bacterium]|jgi:hypothetical protein|nr:hypothetical protein [Burkholderiaceae bacterium]